MDSAEEKKQKLFKLIDVAQEELEYTNKQLEYNKDDKAIYDYLNMQRRELLERRSTLFDVLEIMGWYYDFYDYITDNYKKRSE